MVSRQIAALFLAVIVAGIISSAIILGSSLNGGSTTTVTVQGSSPGGTSLVIQTVDLTRSVTTTVPATTFLTAFVTSTLLNYSNVIRSLNSTAVSVDVTTVTTSLLDRSNGDGLLRDYGGTRDLRNHCRRDYDKFNPHNLIYDYNQIDYIHRDQIYDCRYDSDEYNDLYQQALL